MSEQQGETLEANREKILPTPHESTQETSIGASVGIAKIVKALAEVFTVFAISSYAIGFIIVNSYLLSHGYASNAIFKIT